MATAPSDTPEVVIRVAHLKNSFGEQVVHSDVNLEVRRGEIIGVVGGSGTGKSVLMRSIIGLQTSDAGDIEVLGHDIATLDAVAAKDLRRRWGVLFQNGALFSSLTVAENIEAPMREFFALDPALMDEIAGYKIAMVGLPDLAGPKFPSELSGGMRKRAGLARALALDPDLLFLDEPTAGLGAEATERLADLVSELKRHLTIVVIEHDMRFLFRLADTVSVLHWGQVIAAGTPDELRENPWVQRSSLGAA